MLSDALSRMPMTSTIVMQRDDAEGEDVEDDRDAEEVRRAREEPGNLARPCGSRSTASRGMMMPNPRDERLEVVGPADRDGDVADGVLDDQVPADDPGDELAERGVGVGVGAAGDRHHRRELGVAERGEAAGDGGEDEREDQRGPGAGPRGVAGGGGADGREDAGADDRADAEHDDVERAERPLELMLRALRLSDRMRVEALGAEESDWS